MWVNCRTSRITGLQKTPPKNQPQKPPNPNSWLIIEYVTRELYDGCHLWSRNCLIPSCPPEFTPVFSGIRVAQSLFFCVVFRRLVLVSPFILFVLVIVFCPVPFTVSDFSWTYYKIYLFFVVQTLSYVYVLQKRADSLIYHKSQDTWTQS